MTEQNKEYTASDVTDSMLRAFSTQHPPGYHVVADGIAAAINVSPLWDEVKELRAVMADIKEANRELVEALKDVEVTLIGHGWERLLIRVNEALAKHGGGHE